MSKVFLVRLSRYSIYKVQCRSLAFISCPLRTFICYHNLFRLSRTFFKFFQTFLSCSLPSRRSRSSDNFYILADTFSFVKNFFQILSNFFRFPLDSLPVSQAACIYYHSQSNLSSIILIILLIIFFPSVSVLPCRYSQSNVLLSRTQFPISPSVSALHARPQKKHPGTEVPGWELLYNIVYQYAILASI